MAFEYSTTEEEKNYHFKEDLAYTEDDVLVYNIFVYNIPEKATEAEVMTYFSKFGHVNKVRLVVQPKRKLSIEVPKVGFIHFDHAAHATKVLKCSTQHILKSTRIFVRACDSWRQPHKQTNDSDRSDNDEMPTANGKTFNITMLNEDCLEQIVKKLQLKDQVRFSLACQRFKNVFEMVCKTEHKSHRVENLDPLTLWEIREFFMIAGPNIEAIMGAVPYKNRERVIEFIIKFCPNIKNVNFDCSKLNSTALNRFFKRLKHCTVVELRDCSLTDSAILSLKKLPKLKYLSVADNCELTGKYMQHLTTVKTLILHGCGNIQPSHFVEICKSLKDLQSFDIQRCDRLTAFAEMVENCHKLESLKISCPEMSYENVAHLPCLKKLELLSISSTVPIRLQLFQALAEHKSNQLESLTIVAENCITPEHASLIARLTNLKHLVCANNENLTDECLLKFSELKHLEEIVLENCRAITNEGLLHLVRSCTKLKKVNVQSCSHITDQFVFKVIDVLNVSQNQRGKGPCVFQVDRSGISSYIINHAVYVAATALIKLSLHMPISLGILYPDILNDDDIYGDDYVGDYLSDNDYDDDDPYDMFGVFSDANDFDEDDIEHAYNYDDDDPYDMFEEFSVANDFEEYDIDYAELLDYRDDIDDLTWSQLNIEF